MDRGYLMGDPIAGDDLYDTPGSYTWTCPTGVTSVQVVAIGGGGGGLQEVSGSESTGANGGALAYATVFVVPGQDYDVVVGAGGDTGSVGTPPTAGGDSYFGDITTVYAEGGAAGDATAPAAVATFVGDGGGNGGQGGDDSVTQHGGGGGAGGWVGAGGDGGTDGVTGDAGIDTGFDSPGGGGGGGGSSASLSGGGGGVGVEGFIIGGEGGALNTSGTGGSNGTDGDANGNGGAYGGGGGGFDGTFNSVRCNGADGAVRIVYGTPLKFPEYIPYSGGGIYGLHGNVRRD